jgi:hypothetical protein
MGVSLLDGDGPFPGQSLQIKSLNGSYEFNSTRYLQRIWWHITNMSELYLIRDDDVNRTTRRLFLSDRWPYGGKQGRVREAYLSKKRVVASIVEPIAKDPWGRLKLNGSDWCLTITRCVENDLGACKKDTAIRVRNESQIERGSYLKWTQCLNQTHPSQWFFALPPTPSPTESPTLSPLTEAPTFEDETRSPTYEPSAAPTIAESKEYEPNEYERANKTSRPTEQPTESPTASPTNEPTQLPTDSPTNEPTPNPTSTVIDTSIFLTKEEFQPWKSKLP